MFFYPVDQQEDLFCFFLPDAKPRQPLELFAERELDLEKDLLYASVVLLIGFFVFLAILFIV